MGDIGQGQYKYGAGMGVRVKTPIGPVKLDWGYPLKKIKPFVPLINSAKVGSFCDHRFYQYKGQNISESYHMGIDFASVQNDKIKIQVIMIYLLLNLMERNLRPLK